MDVEFKVPGVIFGISLIVLVAGAAFSAGDVSASLMVGATLIGLAVNVILGIGALFLAAALFQMSFGPLNSAFLKLAATLTAPAAVSVLIPVPLLAWVVSLGTYLGLLSWLFDLEGKEVLISVVVLMVVRWVALAASVAALLAMIHASG